MSVKKAFCIFLLLSNASTFAQTGSKTTDMLLDSARHYIYTDKVKSYSFIQQLDSIAKKENNRLATAYVHHVKGIIDEQMGDNESALSNYSEGISLAEKAQDSNAKSRIRMALSNFYINRSEFQKSIETCQKGIAEALAVSDFETASQFYNNLSLCHSYMREYEKALAYSDKSIELKQKTSNEDGLANAYLNKGLILTSKGNYENGFDYYAKAEAIYLKQSNYVSLTQTYINYGWDYTDLKQFGKARNYLTKAMLYAEKSGDKIRQAGVWNTLGYYYKNAGRNDSVAYALEKGLHLSLEAKNKRNTLIAYQELASHYQTTGNTKPALDYLNKAFQLKDSIFEETKIQQAQALNARYETRQKEEQIKLLHAQQQNNELTIQKQRLTLLAVLLAVATLFLMAYLLFNRYRKKQKARKEQELLAQKEAERVRIARDMHDEMGAGLTRIVMRSEQVKQQLQSGKEIKNDMVETLEKMAGESRQLNHGIGEIIWALNPKNDTLDALCAYLRNYAYDYLEEAGISCHILFPDTIPNTPVSHELRRNIFLIVKEALNNIVKHAQASVVEIKLNLAGNYFSLSIKDNGRGMNSESVLSSGNGLGNMKKRTEECGGKYIFSSEAGKGTQLIIEKIKLGQ